MHGHEPALMDWRLLPPGEGWSKLPMLFLTSPEEDLPRGALWLRSQACKPEPLLIDTCCTVFAYVVRRRGCIHRLGGLSKHDPLNDR